MGEEGESDLEVSNDRRPREQKGAPHGPEARHPPSPENQNRLQTATQNKNAHGQRELPEEHPRAQLMQLLPKILRLRWLCRLRLLPTYLWLRPFVLRAADQPCQTGTIT